ncbi:putative adenylyl-sulfate kinase [archaeon HR01]|nr:putative adenylyl-sulfate kinase [archaeon HR01]
MNRGVVVWFTGLPGSGKTTIAKKLEEILRRGGLSVELLDGDEVRKWLSPDSGFSRQDREIHIKRVAHVAHLLSRNGVVVLVSLVSPYRSSRNYARELIPEFVEVYVKCPLEICVRRDPKGLYRKALAGEISNMTGIQDIYEEPENPDLVIATDIENVDSCVFKVIQLLVERGYLPKNFEGEV